MALILPDHFVATAMSDFALEHTSRMACEWIELLIIQESDCCSFPVLNTEKSVYV